MLLHLLEMFHEKIHDDDDDDDDVEVVDGFFSLLKAQQ